MKLLRYSRDGVESIGALCEGIKKGLAVQGLLCGHILRVLLWDDVDRAGSLFALTDFVLDRLSFFECSVTSGLDLGVVDKELRTAVVGDDKPKALLTVKPFDYTCTHMDSFGLFRP